MTSLNFHKNEFEILLSTRFEPRIFQTVKRVLYPKLYLTLYFDQIFEVTKKYLKVSGVHFHVV